MTDWFRCSYEWFVIFLFQTLSIQSWQLSLILVLIKLQNICICKPRNIFVEGSNKYCILKYFRELLYTHTHTHNTRAHIHRVISGYLLRLLESSSIKLSTINNANAILQHDHHYPEEFLTLYLFLVYYGWQPTFMSNINHRSRQRWKIKGRQNREWKVALRCLLAQSRACDYTLWWHSPRERIDEHCDDDHSNNDAG